MEEGKHLRRMLAGLTALLCLAVGLCGALHLREAEMRREIAMQQQREMADVIAAMAGIVAQLVLIPLLLTALQKAGFAD